MVYLDYNASTPIDPRGAKDVWAVMQEHFANPFSTQHASGRAAREVLAADSAGDAGDVSLSARDHQYARKPLGAVMARP